MVAVTRCQPRFLCTLSPQQSRRPFFANTPLKRHAPHSLPDDMQDLLALPVRFLPFWRNRPLIRDASDNSFSEPVFWSSDQLRTYLKAIPKPLTVPLSQTDLEIQYFALDVSQSETPPVATGEHAAPLRSILPNLSETHANLVAHGKALLSWHSSTIYCSRCGTRTNVTQAGAARLCPNHMCKTRNIYPRVMPSIMAAVTCSHSDAILLGRKASWSPGRYSVLAGFAEIFECLEDTVVREVYEETGVLVQRDTVRYIASQPWPSAPHASLMSGFRAEVCGEENTHITIDKEELEDARWFKRSELLSGLQNESIDIPGHTSMARRLILDWLHEDKVVSFDRESKTGTVKGAHQ